MLSKHFPEKNIYSDFVNQDFLVDCFCIKILETRKVPAVSNNFKIFNKLQIIYVPPSAKNASKNINCVMLKLFDVTKVMPFLDYNLFAKNVNCYISENKLFFELNYDFFLISNHSDSDYMSNLSLGGIYH